MFLKKADFKLWFILKMVLQKAQTIGEMKLFSVENTCTHLNISIFIKCLNGYK